MSESPAAVTLMTDVRKNLPHAVPNSALPGVTNTRTARYQDV